MPCNCSPRFWMAEYLHWIVLLWTHLSENIPGNNHAPVSSTLIDDLTYPPHFILFDRLDAVHLCCVALKLHSAAGPSGLDASAWRCMCTSFQTISDDLCDALSAVARCLQYIVPLWILLAYPPLLLVI